MFKVCLTNLAAYNEGDLVGKWLELPLDDDELKEEIESILRPGDEEIFITDFENDYGYQVGAYENIDRVNEIAALFENTLVEPWHYQAIQECLGSGYEPEEIIEICEVESGILYVEEPNLEELGYAVVAEGYLGIDVPENLEQYIDYEKIGRDFDIENLGMFTWTQSGSPVFVWVY